MTGPGPAQDAAGEPDDGRPDAAGTTAGGGAASDRRFAVALLLASIGFAVWAALLARETLTDARAPLDLGAMTPAQLDTVTVDGRRLTASLGGYVTGFAAPDALWIADDGDAFRVVFPEPTGLDVEDRVLVVGRLRARRGMRWLEATEWTPVVGTAR